MTSLTPRRYLAICFPLILAALSTPLLGAVDTAVVGRLPDPVYIGGVAVASMTFNTLYWLLGFLRMSTSGFTAQAFGSRDQSEMMMTLARPVFLAILFGLLFIIFQTPIKEAALQLIQPSLAVGQQATLYFDIRIWGAPFVLMNYAILGWMIGASNIRLALFIQVFMNLLNVCLSLLFVLGLGMGVEGVAGASLIAEITTLCLGFIMVYRCTPTSIRRIEWRRLMDRAPIVRMAKMNRDLLIRTLCILAMYLLFTSYGARMGETSLAANAILLQIHLLMACVFDGMGNANSVLVGRSIGEQNPRMYNNTIKSSAIFSSVTSASLGILFFLFNDSILSLFTAIPEVIFEASQYKLWLSLFPVIACYGLSLNGVFSGATHAAPLRESLIIALILYMAANWALIPAWGNHGLWAAFTLFYLFRSLYLWLSLPGLQKMVVAGSESPTDAAVHSAMTRVSCTGKR